LSLKYFLEAYLNPALLIRMRTCKYGIFRTACLSTAQGCKNPVAHPHCATKNLVKRRTL